MDELMMRSALREVGGDMPSTEFEERLAIRLDEEADLWTMDRLLGTEPEALEATEVDVLPLEPTSSDAWRVSVTHVLVAAAVALVCGLAVMFAVRDDGPNVVASTSEIADSLVAASEDPAIDADERLALLIEAARIDPSGPTMGALGAELQSRDVLITGRLELDVIAGLTISPDGRFVVVSQGRAQPSAAAADFLLWTVETGEVTPIVPALETANHAAFLPSGLITFSGFQQGEQATYELDDLTTPVDVVAFDVVSAKGSRGVQVRSNNVFVSDAVTGVEQARAQLLWDPVEWRISADGSLIVASQPGDLSAPDRVQVWEVDASSGFVETHPLAELGVVDASRLAFAPNGRTVAAAVEAEVLILDAATYEELARFATDTEAVRMEWFDDGNTLLTLHEAPSRMELWDVETGTRLVTQPVGDDSVGVRYSGINGSHFLSLSASGALAALDETGDTIEVLTLDPTEWLDLACGTGAGLPAGTRAEFGLADFSEPCG